jgi:isocitrate/isopropylmalate dehydrogenase
MHNYRIALIPGEGIGREVIPAALQVLNRAADLTGAFSLTTEQFSQGCEFYLRTGAMMLEHLGQPEAAGLVMAALERVVLEGKTLTKDLGGGSGTAEVANATAEAVVGVRRSLK